MNCPDDFSTILLIMSSVGWKSAPNRWLLRIFSSSRNKYRRIAMFASGSSSKLICLTRVNSNDLLPKVRWRWISGLLAMRNRRGKGMREQAEAMMCRRSHWTSVSLHSSRPSMTMSRPVYAWGPPMYLWNGKSHFVMKCNRESRRLCSGLMTSSSICIERSLSKIPGFLWMTSLTYCLATGKACRSCRVRVGITRSPSLRSDDEDDLEKKWLATNRPRFLQFCATVWAIADFPAPAGPWSQRIDDADCLLSWTQSMMSLMVASLVSGAHWGGSKRSFASSRALRAQCSRSRSKAVIHLGATLIRNTWKYVRSLPSELWWTELQTFWTKTPSDIVTLEGFENMAVCILHSGRFQDSKVSPCPTL